MLTIKIGESYIDTRNLEIPIVLRNPIFNTEKGSFIFNFSLPATPILKEEFGYFHRPSRNTDPFVTKPLELIYGTLKFKGNARVTSADDETYEVSCPIDSGDLAKIFKSLKMADVDMGGVRSCEIGNISVRAVEPTSIVADDSAMANPVYYHPTFESISINVDNLLNSPGNIITADEDGKLVLRFGLEFERIRGYWSYEIIVNSVVFSNTGFDTGSFILYKEVPVSAGDIVTFRIKATPEIAEGTTWIQGTVSGGQTLDVYKQGSMTITDALNLYPDGDFAVFPIENAKFFDNLEDNTYMIDNYSIKEIYSKFFPILNYYRDNNFPLLMLGESEGESFMAYNMFCPFPYLAYFIKRMAAHIGIEIENNVFEENQLKQLVIFNAFAENSFISNDLIKPKEGFDLADHLPDVLISDYWKELCKLLGIAWDYKSFGSRLKLKNLNDIATDTAFIDFPGIVNSKPSLQASPYNGYKLTQEVTGDSYISDFYKSLEDLNYKGSLNSYSGLPWNNNEINDCYYLEVERAFYIWNYDKETAAITWIFHSNDFIFSKQDIDELIDATTLEITTKINAIMNNGNPRTDNQLGSAENRYWSIPKTGQPGNFDGLQKIFNANFSQSLLFYRGLRADGQSNLYPLGTFDVFDYSGNVCEFESVVPEDAYTADLSLRWEGNYGLYEKRYKHWINFMIRSRGEWEFQATLTEQQVSEIDFFKWYKIMNHPYLIKEMRFNLYSNKISPVIIRAVAR